MRHNSPLGMENSMEGRMTPDIQVGYQIYAAHWRKVNSRWRYPSHTHPMFEIQVVLEGEQHMVVDGLSYSQRTSDILFIRPGLTHESGGSLTGKPMTYFCLHFDIDELTLRRSLMNVAPDGLMSQTSQAAGVRQTLDNIITSTIVAENDIHKERLTTLHLSLQLLAALSGLAMINTENQQQTTRTANENSVAFANQIERYLIESLNITATNERRIGIEEIAAHLGYSPAHCNRIFRQVFGLSPRQYLSSLIIRQAKLMLMDSRISVESVAAHLGYRDVSHFSKQFKRWTGLSPMGFRKLGHS